VGSDDDERDGDERDGEAAEVRFGTMGSEAKSRGLESPKVSSSAARASRKAWDAETRSEWSDGSEFKIAMTRGLLKPLMFQLEIN
jgi:hypothetical protein